MTQLRPSAITETISPGRRKQVFPPSSTTGMRSWRAIPWSRSWMYFRVVCPKTLTKVSPLASFNSPMGLET